MYKMPKPIPEYIYIVCPDRAYFSPIKTMGPISRPLKVSKKAATRMVMSGAHVYQYELGTGQTSLLTPENVRDAKPIDAKPIPAPAPPEEKPEDPIPDLEPENIPKVETKPIDVETMVFEYNANGKIDETKIAWGNYTKEERRAIRARINEINSKVSGTPQE